MTSINPNGHDAIRHRSDVADVIVKGAIALVTVAIFLGAYLQFQVPIWQALIAAIGIFIAFMALHSLVRRSERLEVLAKEVRRLESEVANLTNETSGPGPLPDPGWQIPPATPEADLPGLASVGQIVEADASRAAAASADPTQTRDAPLAALPAGPIAGLAPSSSAVELPRATEPQQTKPKQTEPQQAKGPPDWPGRAPESKHDYWALRPSKEPPSENPPMGPAAPQPSVKSEADLDAVQGMLKKLAKEVDVAAGAPVSKQRQAGALKASVDALHTAADSMRAAATKAPPPAEPARTSEAKGPIPPPIVSTHARLSALGEAISADRVDIVVQPIFGLADAKAHHHEVILRLRDPKGSILPGSLRDPALSKTGLTPLFDSARVRRAAEVAASLSNRGHKGSLFVAITAESLSANQFLDAFADAYRERHELAGELVLVFSQAEVAAFSTVQWDALADMRDIGFRFGLEGAGNLSFDFTPLGARGFAFVRLGADVFRKGLQTNGGLVPANSICQYLAGLGLTVIVSELDHEAKRATALDFGAPLGQGPLFGPPNNVASQRVTATGHAAA